MYSRLHYIQVKEYKENKRIESIKLVHLFYNLKMDSSLPLNSNRSALDLYMIGEIMRAFGFNIHIIL